LSLSHRPFLGRGLRAWGGHRCRFTWLAAQFHRALAYPQGARPLRHSNLVAWYKNGLLGIKSLVINQGNPVVVVQHLRPRGK